MACDAISLMIADVHVNRWGSLCSIGVVIVSGAEFLWRVLQPPASLPPLSTTGVQRLQAILLIGLIAAAAHGILWSLAERLRGWDFRAGGGSSLPHGWSSVTLSATMTVPLVVVPPIYSRIFNVQMAPPRHLFAGGVIIGCAAAAHLFLYGSKRIGFPGIRNLLQPIGAALNWRRAIGMEGIYATVHFGSIVLIYHVIVDSGPAAIGATVIIPALVSGLLWFSAVCTAIFLEYPGSLIAPRGIELRGLINALLLMLALQGGMLMRP